MYNKKLYTGHLIASQPGNPISGPIRSVCLLLKHSEEFTVGLQINTRIKSLTLDYVALRNGIELDRDDPLWYGGDTNPNKIHVVHSNDWSGISTVEITKELCVTNDISILSAIAQGEGPAHYRACSGYWIWEDGEFDRQLDPHSGESAHWEVLPANLETVFSEEGIDQWLMALDRAASFRTADWI